jgi:hypothetical protein
MPGSRFGDARAARSEPLCRAGGGLSAFLQMFSDASRKRSARAVGAKGSTWNIAQTGRDGEAVRAATEYSSYSYCFVEKEPLT